jgi:dolichyl-phosphate beta-glucosyltransferase
MNDTEKTLALSIVIPAYNESSKIIHDVEEAAAFLVEQNLVSEVIIVDDGSSDGTADTALKSRIPDSRVKLQVIRMNHNSGKGGAVRRGVLESRGAIVLVADSGTCIPYRDAIPVFHKIKTGRLDIGIASRRHRETVIRRNRPLKRRILSWFFHLAARVLTGIPRSISDSQCGFKIYRGEAARQLFKDCRTAGYLFELEILLRALEKNFRIEEFPVEWTCDLDTRLKPASDAPHVLKDLLKIKKTVSSRSRDSGNDDTA